MSRPTFEQSLSELESIVRKLESSELGLDEALAQYELGIKHLKSCYHLLQIAERRIELVRGIDADGKPITESYAVEEDATLTDKAAARSRKRSAANRRSQVDESGTLF
ncbi:MAG: exodeoxyribonuclease VII small subunit [Pirellulales bacterium]|nr:exodeoxyribonuclease VII small subunit [Pirellulales bacterium]